jgi:hypothetical protein
MLHVVVVNGNLHWQQDNALYHARRTLVPVLRAQWQCHPVNLARKYFRSVSLVLAVIVMDVSLRIPQAVLLNHLLAPAVEN